MSGNRELGLRLNVCNSLGAILNLVEAGTGISILPGRLLHPQLKTGTVHLLRTHSRLPMQDVFIGTNKGAVVRALPQVAQMIRKVSVDVAFCG